MSVTKMALKPTWICSCYVNRKLSCSQLHNTILTASLEISDGVVSSCFTATDEHRSCYSRLRKKSQNCANAFIFVELSFIFCIRIVEPHETMHSFPSKKSQQSMQNPFEHKRRHSHGSIMWKTEWNNEPNKTKTSTMSASFILREMGFEPVNERERPIG